MLGDQLTIFALPWLVASQGSGPLVTGSLVASSFLPTLLFGISLGALADRWPRRGVMIACDLGRVLLLLSIPAAEIWGGGGVAQLLLVAFAMGIGRTLFEPAAQGLLVEIVPEHGLLRANTRLSISESITEVLGPGLAGLLVATVGAGVTLGLDALTFLISAVAIALVGRPGTGRRPDDGGTDDSIWLGLRHLRATSHLWSSTWLVTAANACIGVWAALAILFLQRELGLSGVEAGLIFAANGAGSVAMSLVCVRLATRIGLGRTLLAGLAVSAAGFLAFAASGDAILAAAGMAVVGLGSVAMGVAAVTLRQTLTPVSALGRVSAASHTLMIGGAAIGALAGGVIGDLAGLRAGLVVCAVGLVACTLAGALGPLAGPDPQARSAPESAT